MLSDTLITLDQLEAVGTKRTPKLKLLQQNDGDIILYKIFWYTYNWRMTYGITVKNYKGDGGADSKGITFEEFTNLLDKFEARELTGNAAKNAWKKLFSRCNNQQKKWFTRVINRDLKIGISRVS